MAEDKPAKPKRLSKKTETLRQKAERTGAAAAAPRTRRLKRTAGVASRPFKAAHRIGKKEYYLPMPDNRLGRFLNKKRRATPGFIRNSWQELRKVEWPALKVVMRLTFAVFIFSVIFGLLVTLVDFGLDKLFRKVFL